MAQRDAEARRARVLAAMKSPGSAATRELVGLLADDDPLVREWAIEGLTRRKDRDDAVPDLVKRLDDERADVRWYAARALGKLEVPDETVQAALIRALHDADEYVRCFAAWAMGVLHLKDAIPALQQRLLRDERRKRGLEEQAIGVARARLNTEPRPSDDEERALSVGDVLLVRTLPDQSPRTKTAVVKI